MELELMPKDEPEKVSDKQEPQDGPLLYTGPERRKGSRRVTVDRREMARFEEKKDRRRGQERRGDLKLWDGRNF